MIDHVWGHPDGIMKIGDWLCNESRLRRALRVYHVKYTTLPNGDRQCSTCGRKNGVQHGALADGEVAVAE